MPWRTLYAAVVRSFENVVVVVGRMVDGVVGVSDLATGTCCVELWGAVGTPLMSALRKHYILSPWMCANEPTHARTHARWCVV